MSTLDFVPRTLKRRKLVPTPQVQNPTASNSQPETTPSIMVPPPESMKKNTPRPQKKKKQQQVINPSWDFAFLVWLALSDYWLWADGDLRMKIETGGNASRQADAVVEENSAGDPFADEDRMIVDEQGSQATSDEQGYVPLDHLLKQSRIFLLVSKLQPYSDAKEILYVNSLRQFAKDIIDVRFIVDPESSSTRSAVIGRRSRKPQTGYEVRRTDFASLKDSEFSRYSKSRWDGLTVYLENIPLQNAKVPGIGELITSLLPASSSSPMKRVQNIDFPLHHQDLPESIPICKGFALVTLSTEDDVQALLSAWPWNSEKPASTSDSTEEKQDDMTLENNHSAEEMSAKTGGLRICTKAHWEGLKAEYLLHRHQLIDEINQYQETGDARLKKETMDKAASQQNNVASGSKRKQPESTTQYEIGIRPDSSYPNACLVFVRHVHPETNKTTLRTLFSQAWAEGVDAIDYIDYSKNMDSCHVRFGTPAHAEFFVDYFSSHRFAQLSGLDNVGSESSEVKAILPEIVLGKREEVYWDRIPEKLRRQAVEKTLKAMYGPDFVGGSSATGPEEASQGGDGGRKKRRRKAKASE